MNNNEEYVMRTNYFRVTDEEKFHKIISRVMDEDDLDVSVETMYDELDTKYFAFGAYGNIDNDEYSFDDLCVALQEVIPEDEAIIIMQIGHDRIRSVTGNCTVITRCKIRCIDMISEAEEMACSLLGNPQYMSVAMHVEKIYSHKGGGNSYAYSGPIGKEDYHG